MSFLEAGLYETYVFLEITYAFIYFEKTQTNVKLAY
jgi:hypothetical protein